MEQLFLLVCLGGMSGCAALMELSVFIIFLIPLSSDFFQEILNIYGRITTPGKQPRY